LVSSPYLTPQQKLKPQRVTTDPCVAKEEMAMLEQLFGTFVMLLPVFFLLLLIFGAGFYIGRVSKRE